ncbi:MAG: S8 family serine peptidase [Chitinophagales bacterium]|nr:S8 family serine peptidase [Chitinophagales bacterium]
MTKASELSSNYYGEAFTQIEMLKGNYLHQKNLMGEGLVIGIMDSGFKNANSNRAFQKMLDDNRLLGAFDFVEEDFDIFSQYNHGTWVLSVMAADLPGEIVGTAPLASYYLFRTEDSKSESLMEEDNWVAAAEMADQLGVDILNTSLGYFTFDDPSEDHEYADLDGNTTIITRAADMAAQKGMLVVTSAGNEGNKSWFYITAPADGDSVLTVGAVNSNFQVADFSSHGPAADGDIKPNICAMGSSVTAVGGDGALTKISGTSFSAPIISGLAACLWQAFPERNNMDIFNAIEQSANYAVPDDECGYGIPDFELAFNLLANDLIDILDDENTDLIISPNPVNSQTKIFYRSAKEGIHTVGLYDMNGKEVYYDEQYLFADQYNKINLDTQNIGSGVYVVRIIQTDVKIEGLLLKTP